MLHWIMKSKLNLLPFFLLALALGVYPKLKNPEPRTHIVEIKRMKFIPATLEVSKGDIVTWVNKDFVPHDVTEKDNSWSSKPFGQNETWSTTVTDDIVYYCNLHKVMKGQVTVK